MNIVSAVLERRRRKREWEEHDGDDRTAFVLARLQEVTERSDRVAAEVEARAAALAPPKGANVAR